MKTFTAYHHAVDQLEALIAAERRNYMAPHEHDKRFFLERTQRFFDVLGNPEKKFRYIHVAGTSGKGSTAAMIHNILASAGWRVGLYTSPHVTTTIERISINGLFVAPEDVVGAIAHIMPLVEHIAQQHPDMRPSYTETLLGIAMSIFEQHHVEWVVLETGCGGRFDHTNMIPAPDIAVITNVTREHVGVLGNRIEEIAWHKAGIIKKGSRLFSAEPNAVVRNIFDNEAAQYNQHVEYVTSSQQLPHAMPGRHQDVNSALAAAVASALGLNQQCIAEGIARTRLPARVEIMQEHPFIICDGAHAPAKMEALATFLTSEQRFIRASKRSVIFAPKEGKEVKGLIAPLAPLFHHVVLTSWQLPGFQSADPHIVAKLWKKAQPATKIVIIPDAFKALKHTLDQHTAHDAIIITSSLYLAGLLRSHWITEEDILRTRSAFPS